MFHHAQPSVSSLRDDVVTRMQKALATASISQMPVAIRAVASALSELAPPAAMSSLSRQLAGEVGAALAEASREGNLLHPSADASLVMEVAAKLPRGFPAHACAVVRVVLAEIAHQAGPDHTRAFVAEMPARLRKLWPTAVWKLADTAHAE